ncbi:MAG: hypothetical protein H7Y88_12115 [Phycisphaerales bacterium]|nr:hypothetical protein [Phycisphaerales bacterium]
MLDQTTNSRGSLVGPVVPSWAFELAPCLRESRVVCVVGKAIARVDHFHGLGAGMITAVVPSATDLSAVALREAVAEVFGLVLGGLHDDGFPHPVRIWAFVPGIHDQMAEGMDRYRVFNAGRYDAFIRWCGGSAAFEKILPAASAVGHSGDRLVVSALGLRTPGMPVENPRQTPAFGYSPAHGPRPPCFSRAMLAMLPNGTRLLVSGTASIRGENSVHHGSLESQLEETFDNLHHLMQSVKGAGQFSLRGIETTRVYFPRAEDRAALMAGVSARLPVEAAVEYVPAWVCRPELLVEIEATCAPLPS